MSIDNKSLTHTIWNFKYHIISAPKYRRMVFYSQKTERGRNNIKNVVRIQKVNIIEAKALEILEAYFIFKCFLYCYFHNNKFTKFGYCFGFFIYDFV